MSIESMSKALHVADLGQAEKLVLIGIANHDGDGGAWPSLETLRLYACLGSVRQVRRLIRSLEAKGLVSTEVNAGGTASTRGDRRPNLYHLHLSTAKSDGGTQDVRPLDDGGTSQTPRGDMGVSDGGTHMSAEPSLNRPQPSAPSSVDKFEQVVGRLVEESMKGKTIANPTAYRTAVAEQARIEYTERIRELLERFPDAPVDVITASTLGDTHSLRYYTEAGA